MCNKANNKFDCELDTLDNTMAIESLYSTYVLLDTFQLKSIISKAVSLDAQLKGKYNKESFRHGYKLHLIALFDNYIDNIIRNPELIGVEPDLDYRDYWSFIKGRGRNISNAITRPNHDISKLVERANLYIKEILTLNTWEQVYYFEEKTKSFRENLKIIAEKGFICAKRGKKAKISDALLKASISFLFNEAGNPLPLAHKYTDYFIPFKNDDFMVTSLDEIIEECDVSSGMTRLDFTQINPALFPRPLPTQWALGYGFWLHESLKELVRNDLQLAMLKTLDEFVINIHDWQDIVKYDRKLLAIFGPPKLYSEYCYSKKHPISEYDRLNLLANVEGNIPQERLLNIFGNRARIVERGSLHAIGSFECLLDGALKRSKKINEKVKIAIIVHDDNNQEDYSLAIFMPAYGGGMISTNASMWWVYYLIGNNHSGTASYTWSLILKKLKRNCKAIDSMLVNASEAEFYEYCEDPGYLRQNKAVTHVNRITSDVRGAFPELLLANMLTNRGCSKVNIGFKPKILKQVKGELDVFGLEYTDQMLQKIIIFESKGRATVDNDLQDEINHFSKNIKIIEENLKSFCIELNLPYSDIVKVEATFVSMDTLEYIKIDVPANIRLWNFNDLVINLKQNNIPKKYLDLLKMTIVAVSM